MSRYSLLSGNPLPYLTLVGSCTKSRRALHWTWFTNLQPDELLTKMHGISSSAVTAKFSFASQTPIKYSKLLPKWHGVWPSATCLATEQRLRGVTYTRGSDNGGGPLPEEAYWQQFTRALSRMVVSRQSLDANQSNYSYIRTHTYTAN